MRNSVVWSISLPQFNLLLEFTHTNYQWALMSVQMNKNKIINETWFTIWSHSSSLPLTRYFLVPLHSDFVLSFFSMDFSIEWLKANLNANSETPYPHDVLQAGDNANSRLCYLWNLFNRLAFNCYWIEEKNSEQMHTEWFELKKRKTYSRYTGIVGTNFKYSLRFPRKAEKNQSERIALVSNVQYIDYIFALEFHNCSQ